MNEGEPVAKPKLSGGRKKMLLRLTVMFLLLIITFVAVLVVLNLLHHRHDKAANDLPASVLQEIHGFKPYYFQVGSTTGFTLEPQTVSYDEGVLIFEMKNPVGKTLAFTEEATPPNYDISALSADKQFNTGYGQAFITDSAARTTGALFTSNHTWILLNAPRPIGGDLMQQILNSLVPVTN